MEKFQNLLKNYGWLFFSYFTFFILVWVFGFFFPDFDFQRHQQTEMQNLLQENFWLFFMLAVFIAPVVEEAMFRTLIKPTPGELLLFMCSWGLVILLSFLKIEAFWMIRYGAVLFLAILLYFLLRALFSKQLLQSISDFLNKNHLGVWILTSLAFGFIHIFNYVEGFQFDFLLFLLIVPRIIAGFFFGRIKIENKSLGWPILLHAMNNGTVLLIIYSQLNAN